MHIDPCDHMSNTGSDVSVSIPQPAPLQSNGSGYNTIQWEYTWEESIQRRWWQRTKSAGVYTVGVYNYIHTSTIHARRVRLFWDQSGTNFFHIFCENVRWVPTPMRCCQEFERVVVYILASLTSKSKLTCTLNVDTSVFKIETNLKHLHSMEIPLKIGWVMRAEGVQWLPQMAFKCKSYM